MGNCFAKPHSQTISESHCIKQHSQTIQEAIQQARQYIKLQDPNHSCASTFKKIESILDEKWPGKFYFPQKFQKIYKFRKIPKKYAQELKKSRLFIFYLNAKRQHSTKEFKNHYVILYPQFYKNSKSWVLVHSWQKILSLQRWMQCDIKQIAHQISTGSFTYQTSEGKKIESMKFSIDLFKDPCQYISLFVGRAMAHQAFTNKAYYDGDKQINFSEDAINDFRILNFFTEANLKQLWIESIGWFCD